MKRERAMYVTMAVLGLIVWQGEAVWAQNDQGTTEPSAQAQETVQVQDPAQMRRGYPGHRLGKVDDGARGRRRRISLIVEDEGKQLKALGADRSLTKEQKKERYLKIREATRDRIKALLPPEEQKKYEESQAKSRAFRESLRNKMAQKSQP